MNREDDDQTAAPGDGEGAGEGRAESGAARVRRILIGPLADLPRPKGVSAGVHAETLDRLAQKLAYMEEAALRGLVELCLGFAGRAGLEKRVAPVCPNLGLVLAWAYGLQAPPIGQSDYPASVMRSLMGRRAYDGGFGVELLRAARRYGPPPTAYVLTRLRDEADANRRRRAALRAEIEAGNRLSPDQQRWLDDWHRDAEAVERLIAEGDDRRDAKGVAA